MSAKSAPSIWRPEHYRTSAWWVLLVSLLWSALAQLDPFGATSAANRQSEEMLIRLFGAWYPEAARDRITVVLIDDAYLDTVNSNWPLSYAQQELLLDEITAYGPKAVFLDLLHLHRHAGDVERVDRALNQLKSRVSWMSGAQLDADVPPMPLFVPFLLSDLPDVDSCSDTRSPTPSREASVVPAEITPLLYAAGARDTYIGWTGCGTRYPSLAYGDSTLPTPAFALYDYYCESVREDDRPPGCQPEKRLRASDSAARQPMMVRWGDGSSDLMLAAYEQAGLASHCRSAGVLTRLGKMILDAFDGRDVSARNNPCPFTDTVNATYLPGGQLNNADWLEAMIRDRIVLVGTWLESPKDAVTSPIHGKTAGVYLLATALDNYLVYGRNHFHDVSPRLMTLIEVLLLTMTTLVIRAIWIQRHTPEDSDENEPDTMMSDLSNGDEVANSVREGERERAIWRQALAFLATVAVYKLLLPIFIALPTAIVFWHMSWAPVNWLAVAALAFIANPVRLHHCIPKRYYRDPNRPYGLVTHLNPPRVTDDA